MQTIAMEEGKTKMIRCDEPMRRSKERAVNESWGVYGIPGWKCTGKCSQCICGLVMDSFGVWSHVTITR